MCYRAYLANRVAADGLRLERPIECISDVFDRETGLFVNEAKLLVQGDSLVSPCSVLPPSSMTGISGDVSWMTSDSGVVGQLTSSTQ
jgi:hypothetical protein